MNHIGNNGSPPGNPHGMKRRLTDPRQRLQQNRQFQNGAPPLQPPQQPPPQQPQQQQQQHPGGHFPGRLQQQPPTFGRGPGRGFPPHQSPHMAPPSMGGRGGMMNTNGRGPGPAGRNPPMMAGRGPMFGGRGMGAPMAGRNQPMMGRAPPPPPPQRGPFMPPPGMNSNQGQNNLMHRQAPPAPPMMGYANNNRLGPPPPPPPPPRPPFAPPHQQQQQYHPSAPQIMHPNNRHAQMPPQQQQQLGMSPPMHHAPPQQQPHQAQRPPFNQFQRHGHLPLQSNISHAQQPGNLFPSMPAGNPLQQQQPTVVSAPSPKMVSAPYSQAQIDQAWTEYANDSGVKYYHNSILQKSTYDKPKAFVSSQQSQQAQKQPSVATATPTTSSTTTTPRAWAEYTDTNSGKKYYSNGVTTTWEKPDGFVSAAAIVAQSNVKEEAATASESAKKKRKKSEKETPFRNNEEALAAFKGLLLAKEILPTAKWNDVVKLCSSDSRWEDCEAVLTTGERKQAMAEYQTKRANELRTKERQERARAKDVFLQLLTEVLPKQTHFAVWTSRFGDIRDSISKDDRFYAVHDEETRESLFLDFCEELRKHDERKKRNKKREAQEAFCSFLKEKEGAGTLSFSSTWNSFHSSLQEPDKEDSRFKVSPFMTDSDRQVYFADFVIDLQAAEDDKRRRIRDARRRAEKAQRDAYRDAFEKLASQGNLMPSSHWRDIERIIESDSSYAVIVEQVREQDREAPREMFEDFVQEWEELYRRDRQFLSQLVHPTSNREILVTKDTTYDEFVKALLEEAKAAPQAYTETYTEARRITKTDEPISSARVYFNELVKRAKDNVPVPFRKRGQGARRASLQNDDSSEDEGEIIEDGEEVEDRPDSQETEGPATSQPSSVNVEGEAASKHNDDGEVASKQNDEGEAETASQQKDDEGQATSQQNDAGEEASQQPASAVANSVEGEQAVAHDSADLVEKP